MLNSNEKTILGLDRKSLLVFIAAIMGWTLVNVDGSFFNMVYPLMMEDLNFDATQLSFIFTLMYVAAAVGTLIVGPTMDKVGRRPIFIFTLWLTAIGSVLTGLATGFIMVLFCRMITQVGASSEMASGQTMVAESAVSKHRNFLIGFAQIGWPLGFFIGALITKIVVPELGWRALFFIGLLPILAVLFVQRKVGESERFLEVKKLRKEAEELEAKKHLDDAGAAAELDAEKTQYKLNKRAALKGSYVQLFSKDLRRNTIAMWLWQFIYNFGAAGIISYLALVVSDRGIDTSVMWTITLISSGVAIPGYISAAWLGSKFGGKPVSIIYLLIGSAAGIYLALGANDFASITFAYSAFYFFAIGQMGAGPGFIAESVPTRARGTGVAFIGGASWFGFILAGYSMPVLFSHFAVTGAVFVWCGLAPILAAICVGFAKGVKPGQELEDIAN